MATESLSLREARAMLALAEVMHFMSHELGGGSAFGMQLNKLVPQLVERGRDRLRGGQPGGPPRLTVVD